MPEPARREGNTLIINGDHPNVRARTVERKRREVHVTVSPVSQELATLIGEGPDNPERVVYEGPVGNSRLRIEVLQRRSQIGSSGSSMKFVSTGPPEWKQ